MPVKKRLEFEIKDFVGIQKSKTNPQINACYECKNFDLRENLGDLISREGYSQKYAAPTHSRLSALTHLFADNFYVPDVGGGSEVTLQISKATLNEETNAGLTPSTLNILAFWIRPYWGVKTSGTISSATTTEITTDITTTANQYVGGLLRITRGPSPAGTYFRKIISHTTGVNAVFTIELIDFVASGTIQILDWIDEWHWLNEMVLTKITDIPLNPGGGGPYQTSMELYYGPGSDNEFRGCTIYNYTKDEFDVILAQTEVGPDTFLTANTGNSWDVDDIVIITRNYIPLDYLQNMYNTVSKADIVSHRIFNDLRIGFGGNEKRLGVTVGYRSKVMDLAGYPPSNPTSVGVPQLEGVWLHMAINEIVLQPYNTINESERINVSVSTPNTGSLSAQKIFYYVTEVLDDYNEYVIGSGSFEVAVSDEIDLTVQILSGLLHKLTTKIKVYFSSNATGAAEATNPYFLAGEAAISVKEEITASNMTFVTGDYYEIYFNWDTTINKIDEINDLLGYSPIAEYAASWDWAIVTGGRTLMLNPFIDTRYLNFIFYSPIVGKTFRYDVVSSNNYYSLYNFDGADIIVLGVLPNLDLLVLKSTTINYLDTGSGAQRLIEYGKGIVSKKSLVNAGRTLMYAGPNDVHLTDGFNTIIDISDGTIRGDYRALTSTQKASIIAIREDKDNAYRFFTGDTSNKTEFILTKRGWISAVRNLYPECYMNARDSGIWFMRSGAIYYPANAGVATATIPLSWKSIPFDISLISELKNVERFYVLSMWVMYSTISNQTINIKIYVDGSGTALDSKQIISGGAVSRVKTTKVLDVPNKSCRYFQLGIDGNDTIGQQVIIHSVGMSWTPAETGIFEK